MNLKKSDFFILSVFVLLFLSIWTDPYEAEHFPSVPLMWTGFLIASTGFVYYLINEEE